MCCKTRYALGVLLVTAGGCFTGSAAEQEADCQARNDPTEVYSLSANPLVSPVPAVGAETSLFVQLTAAPTQSCTWSDGQPDWFTGLSQPQGCTCTSTGRATSFTLAQASCSAGTCEVLYVGDFFEGPVGGEREVRLVPKAASYELHMVAIPDSDPTAEVELVYAGAAPG